MLFDLAQDPKGAIAEEMRHIFGRHLAGRPVVEVRIVWISKQQFTGAVARFAVFQQRALNDRPGNAVTKPEVHFAVLGIVRQMLAQVSSPPAIERFAGREGFGQFQCLHSDDLGVCSVNTDEDIGMIESKRRVPALRRAFAPVTECRRPRRGSVAKRRGLAFQFP